MKVGDKIIMVDEEYFKELKSRSLILEALEDSGVDDWVGYNKAMKMWNKKRKELYKKDKE